MGNAQQAGEAWILRMLFHNFSRHSEFSSEQQSLAEWHMYHTLFNVLFFYKPSAIFVIASNSISSKILSNLSTRSLNSSGWLSYMPTMLSASGCNCLMVSKIWLWSKSSLFPVSKIWCGRYSPCDWGSLASSIRQVIVWAQCQALREIVLLQPWSIWWHGIHDMKCSFHSHCVPWVVTLVVSGFFSCHPLLIFQRTWWWYIRHILYPFLYHGETVCYNFTYSEPWPHLFYSSLRPDRSRLILYDTLTALSVSLTVEFLLLNYFSHDYSALLRTYSFPLTLLTDQLGLCARPISI